MKPLLYYMPLLLRSIRSPPIPSIRFNSSSVSALNNASHNNVKSSLLSRSGSFGSSKKSKHSDIHEYPNLNKIQTSSPEHNIYSNFNQRRFGFCLLKHIVEAAEDELLIRSLQLSSDDENTNHTTRYNATKNNKH